MKAVDVIIAGSAALIVCLLLALYIYSFRRIFQYEIGPDSLQVKLFGVVPLRRVKLKDIDEVTIISSTDALPFSRKFRLGFIFAEHWPSYVPQNRAVFIRKRTGISRRLVLTPQNAQEFSEKILLFRRGVPDSKEDDPSSPAADKR